MATSTTHERPAHGPGIARTITLTDAIVAIAMTLLILPVVDVADKVDTRHLGRWVQTQGGLLLSFAISFLVIYVFWSVHAAALRQLEASHTDVPGLRVLNMWWLLLIAFLPFPTAVVGHETDTRSAPLYIGTMLVLSALTSAIVTVADRYADQGRPIQGWATTSVFALCTVVSFFNADAGLYLLFLLIVLRIVESRLSRHR